VEKSCDVSASLDVPQFHPDTATTALNPVRRPLNQACRDGPMIRFKE